MNKSKKKISPFLILFSGSLIQEPALMGGKTSFYGDRKDNPFAETFPDPLCKLHLKETSEFVKSFPMAGAAEAGSNGTRGRVLLEASSTQGRRNGVTSVVTQRRVADQAAPSTPGRPVFSFSVGNFSRKSIPYKWDDAEKWLICSSCNDSPSHYLKQPLEPTTRYNNKQQMEIVAEKSSFIEDKSATFNGVSTSSDVVLKDKFTDYFKPVSPDFPYLEPSKEGFLFNNTARASLETMKDSSSQVVINEIKHRVIGTEMTPLGSSTTSRCHTPFKSASPLRHNTPESRSGPLALVNSSISKSTIDIAIAELQLGSQYDSFASNWSSRKEEEKEICKSLRHFETGSECRKSVSDSRAAAFEEEERTKCCLRYQREEAKIQACLNLQNAKAVAQSRKLEVKIQKMRSNLEQKLMKRMAIAHRKAEDWRAVARQQHTEQIQKATEQGHKMIDRSSLFSADNSIVNSCGCFPCSNNH